LLQLISLDVEYIREEIECKLLLNEIVPYFWDEEFCKAAGWDQYTLDEIKRDEFINLVRAVKESPAYYELLDKILY